MTIKPCPFCGRSEPRLVEVNSRWYFACYNCGALGPNKPNRGRAEIAWNTRGETEKKTEKAEKKIEKKENPLQMFMFNCPGCRGVRFTRLSRAGDKAPCPRCGKTSEQQKGETICR